MDSAGKLAVNVPWTDTNTTYAFSNKAATLNWGTTSTIATVGGTDITVTMPTNPNTNTTYTLTQDATDGHKIIFTPSSGTATTITIPDNNTTYSAATTSAAGLMSAADKSKLDGIAAQANKYTLPTASSSTLGGIKVGTDLNISSGVLSVASAPKVDHGLSVTVSGISQGTFDGSANVTIDVNASSLGLSSGLHFRGFVSAAPTGTTYTLISGSATTAQNGDVVIIKSTGVEYLYNNGTWTQIGDSTSYALHDHSHGNIDTNGRILNASATAVNNSILRSDGTGKIIAGPVIGTGTTKFLREDGTWVEVPVTNTTYTFASGTNGFTVTPSGGSAQTVTVTPSIANNVTGSGTSGYLTKFNGTNTITNGPALGSSTTTYLRNDGSWATPPNTDTKNTAGSTDTSSKIFLIGATSQAANPQTYSDNEVYATNGQLDAKSLRLAAAVSLVYDSTNKCLNFNFA